VGAIDGELRGICVASAAHWALCCGSETGSAALKAVTRSDRFVRAHFFAEAVKVSPFGLIDRRGAKVPHLVASLVSIHTVVLGNACTASVENTGHVLGITNPSLWL
jgi:hypothetical protein